MYETFFGLRERPFELTPTPRFLLLTPGQRAALSNLEYSIASRRGLTAVLGDAGTGKTTLLRVVLGRLRMGGGLLRAGPCCYICNPTLTRQEFFETLARDFGLSVSWMPSKARLLHELRRVLVQTHAAGGCAALVVDEAHSLPHELLEDTRDVVVEIHSRSRGIPRVINVAADHALTSGYALAQRPFGLRRWRPGKAS